MSFRLWFPEKSLGSSGLAWLDDVEVCSDFEKNLEVPLGVLNLRSKDLPMGSVDGI